MATEWQDLAQRLSLLSDATRLRILHELVRGPKSVTDLCEALRAKQPTVSHHLGLLRMGQIVAGTRQGKSVIYRTESAAISSIVASLYKLRPRQL